MSPKRFCYKTVLFSPVRGGVYAAFPYNVRKEFGTGRSVRIQCWIDNYHKKEGSLVPMGGGEHAIHVRHEIREYLGKNEGDEVEIVVEENLSLRRLEIPEDFKWLLEEDPELKRKFENLSFSYQSVIIAHINEAKRMETRVRRIEDMLSRIRIGFYPGQKNNRHYE